MTEQTRKLTSTVLQFAIVATAVLTVCLLSGGTPQVGAQIILRPILPNPEDFVEISAGGYHTCARKQNGNVYCWGRNNTGQVGAWSSKLCSNVSCVDRPTFVTTASKLDAGWDHTCTLDGAGLASCWGNSSYGQLGAGVYGYVSAPVRVSGTVIFSSISAGMNSTCGTSSSGLYCWGQIMNATGGVPTPQQIFAWNGFSSVSVGYLHACALYVVGSWREADCWGRNNYGQVGVDPGLFPIAPPTLLSSLGTSASRVTTQGDFTCADQMSGVVQCTGYNYYGQLGNGQTGNWQWNAQTVGGGIQLRGVSTGVNHACALNPSGGAVCWGNGYSGQLGNSQSGVFSSPQNVTGGLTFRSIASGYLHTCAIGTNNRIYCWGSNTYGQLGTQFPGGWVWSPVQTADPI